MKSKFKVKIYKKPQPRRKDSFWFDGHVATVKLADVSVDIMATGHIDIIFNEDEPSYENTDARKVARKRGYTDKKLDNVHGGWLNNNWFGFIINLPGDTDSTLRWDDATAINFDDAISMAKQIIKDYMTFATIGTLVNLSKK